MEAGIIPLTKLENSCFLSPFKVFICRIIAFGSLLLTYLVSILMFTLWTFEIFIQIALIQCSDDTGEYPHVSEHDKIFLGITHASILSMMKKARNNPVYWNLRWLYFYLIMGTRFIMWKICIKAYHEIF